jgi:PAS domain S-box-containing protein
LQGGFLNLIQFAAATVIKDVLPYPLESKPKDDGLTAQILSLRDGDHLCLFYDEDPGEQTPALIPFIRQGFERDEQFIYIADDHTVDQLTDLLEASGIDVASETERGRLKLWTREEWRQPGELSSEKKADQVRRYINGASTAGFKGIRLAVEMTWTLGPDIPADRLEHWEATINTLLVPSFPGRIICQYNRSRLSPEIMVAALHTHPLAIIGDEVHSNHFYEAPLILHEKNHHHAAPTPTNAAVRVDWMISQLKQVRVVEKQRLELAQRKRTEQRLALQYSISRILADSDTIPQASQRVLEAIGESLGWEIGAFWTMEPGRRRITCCELWTAPGRSAPALREAAERVFFEVDEGGPGRVWKSKKPIWISDLQRDPNFPRKDAAREDGMRSYFSFPIMIQNDVVRTVEFFSASSRQRSAEILELMTSIGTQMGQFIEQTAAEMASRHLAAIVESSSDAVISKDLNGVISSWNSGAERIFGYTSEEVVGQPVTILIPADRQEEEPAILARIHRGERIDHFETIRRRKDGTLLDISLTISPIRDRQGRIIGISKIARDITEQKQAERVLQSAKEQLAKSNEELETRVQQRTASLREAIAQMEEFSYSVSHDLRSPVRAMQGYARAVIEDFGDRLDPIGREYLERIVRSSTRMDRLIQDILTFSRISRREIQLQPVGLEKLVREIIQQYAEMQSPQAEIAVASPLHDVIGHEPSLSQAISNLLNNAVKFVRPGTIPHVQISTDRVDGSVKLWVADNGIGIHPQYQHRLFGLFERIHPEKKYDGTGIGLAIVRRAVERMGGKAGMESDGIHGSRFWIQLTGAA